MPIALLALSGCARPPAPAPAAVVASAAVTVPVSLVGKSPAGLRAWIGAPALRRVDGAAQVWVYNTGLCRLDVIFYPDAQGAPQVTAAMPMPTGMSSASCLASLEQNHAS